MMTSHLTGGQLYIFSFVWDFSSGFIASYIWMRYVEDMLWQFFHGCITGDKIVGKTNNIDWSNKRKLPKLAKSIKNKMERYLIVIYTSNNCTPTTYKSKPSKKVILSSKHKCVKINNDKKRILETDAYCNKIKFGVDVTDQMARRYSVKSKLYRWPVQVFFNVLELIGINAWILYKDVWAKYIKITISVTISRRACRRL